MNPPATKRMIFRLWTYDVWGNARDGYNVNDRFDQGEITLTARCKVYNVGTPNEFASYELSDRQLNRAIGARGLTWDGESEYTLYAETESGKPVCELERVPD